jgi:hypothetical protein
MRRKYLVRGYKLALEDFRTYLHSLEESTHQNFLMAWTPTSTARQADYWHGQADSLSDALSHLETLEAAHNNYGWKGLWNRATGH